MPDKKMGGELQYYSLKYKKSLGLLTSRSGLPKQCGHHSCHHVTQVLRSWHTLRKNKSIFPVHNKHSMIIIPANKVPKPGTPCSKVNVTYLKKVKHFQQGGLGYKHKYKRISLVIINAVICYLAGGSDSRLYCT